MRSSNELNSVIYLDDPVKTQKSDGFVKSSSYKAHKTEGMRRT
jgi:hypothetical protein